MSGGYESDAGRRLALAATLTIAAVLARIALPTLAAHYWTRLAISLQFLASAPNTVLSGRIDTWKVIADFLVAAPVAPAVRCRLQDFALYRLCWRGRTWLPITLI